jgi:hypothetical protein
MRRLLALAWLLSCGCAVHPSARELYDRGVRHALLGQNRLALDELEAAYRINRNQNILLVMMRLSAKEPNPWLAVRLLRRCRGLATDETQRQAIDRDIAARNAEGPTMVESAPDDAIPCRILAHRPLEDGESELRINLGSADGVWRLSTGLVLAGDSGRAPIRNGALLVSSASPHEAVAVTPVDDAILSVNPRCVIYRRAEPVR